MAADRPPGPDTPLDGSGDGAAGIEVLRRRQEGLPPEHPSSAKATDTRQAPDAGHGDPDFSRSRDTDQREPGKAQAGPDPDADQQPPADARPVPDAEPHSEAADRRPLTDIEHNDHIAKIRDSLDKARADGLETWLRHGSDPDREAWTRDRRMGHNEIIAELYGAARDVPCERKAILAGGLPGAGKTTTLEQHVGVDRSRYLTVNPDVVKEEMAKRGMIPKVPGLSPMEASELVHEESSHVAKRLARRAMREGKNVIWDITMSSQESTETRIRDLRGFGYSRIEGIFVDISLETSIRRADARHREDHDKYRAGDGLGGRYVAPELIKAQADKEWGSCNRKTFENVKSRFDAWTMYENSVDGRAPLLVDSRREEDTQ